MRGHRLNTAEAAKGAEGEAQRRERGEREMLFFFQRNFPRPSFFFWKICQEGEGRPFFLLCCFFFLRSKLHQAKVRYALRGPHSGEPPRSCDASSALVRSSPRSFKGLRWPKANDGRPDPLFGLCWCCFDHADALDLDLPFLFFFATPSSSSPAALAPRRHPRLFDLRVRHNPPSRPWTRRRRMASRAAPDRLHVREEGLARKGLAAPL